MTEPKIYRNSATRNAIYSHYNGLTDSSRILTRKFPEILNGLESKVVVDLGCGFGSNFIAFLKQQSKQPRYIHIDSEPRAFEEERRNEFFSRSSYHVHKPFTPYNREDDQQIVADAMEIPLEDGSVDIVHVELTFADTDMPDADQEQALKEIERILVNGGHFVSHDGADILSKDWYKNREQRICPSLERAWRYDSDMFVFGKGEGK